MTALRQALRSVVIPFGAGFGAVLGAAACFGRAGWSWLVVVLLAGMIGLALRRWEAPATVVASCAALGVVAYDVLATFTGLPRDAGAFWWLATTATSALVWVAVWLTGHSRNDEPVRERTLLRRLGLIIVALTLIAGAAYVGYIGYRSRDFTEAIVETADCRTPTDVYGWTFEPINYDAALDSAIRASNVDVKACARDLRGAPAGNEVVTTDGIQLAGWYIPAANGQGPQGPTLLIVHGWKSDKTGALDYAWPFHRDYNLVLFDLRNHGQSSGSQTSMGLWEQRDATQMLEWLASTKQPRWIGGVGNSMGAATLLAVATADPRLEALVLDSMHADSVTSIENALENDFDVPGGPAALALVTGISLRVGGDVQSVDPIANMTRLGARPVLLLQGTADQVDPPDEASDRNLRAALAAGVPAEVEYCLDATHGRVIQTCPEQWAGRALDFLARAQASASGS